MKPRLGDDAESGDLKLGRHAFSDDAGATDSGVTGGYSFAVRAFGSFGSIVAPGARSAGGVASPGGRGSITPRPNQKQQ